MTLKVFPESSKKVKISNEEKEEKKVRRKIDLMIIPTVAMLYLWCFIDRANIGNARLGTMEKTLGMNPKSYQFNILLTSFYCSYIVFEIPSTIMTKLVGPKIWIPFITFCYGLFSMSTGFCRSYHSAIVVRFLLGIAEAGMLPSVALYLSRFYKKDELALRLALYIVTAPLAGAFGGLLASGILRIDHIGKFTNWEMIFLIEGLITMGLSFIGYFTMTDRIETANWLTETEKALAIKRLQVEMIGETRLIDKANKRSIIRGILAPTSLMCALMFLFTNITVQGIAFFLPTIIRSLYPNKSTIHQQLLTVPPNVLGAFGVLVSAFVSTRYRTRFPVVFVNSIFMATGYLLFLTSSNLNVCYAGCFITCLGAYSMGALLPAWASINTNNDSERVGAIGVVIMFGNVGGLIATWSYLPKHKPDYIPGNALNLAAGIGIGLLSTFLFIWQRRQNTKRQRGDNNHLMENKTDEEIEKLGLKHPGFRFKY